MARITIDKGLVTRIFFNGKGVELTETYPLANGETGRRTFTAWFQEPVEFGVGASGKFSGLLSVKIRDWTDKDGNPVINKATGKQGQSADVSLNATKFTPDENDFKPTKQAADWGAPADDMPF